MKNPPSGISRYLTIDLIRGFALFANVFVHIFTDVFNLDPITSHLFEQPVSMLLLFITIGYFGSFGSLFIMISATGNMFSIHGGLEKGKTPKAVAMRQIVSGLILLVFSFMVEGIFQFYGFFGTFFAWNGHEFDPSRIVWHAYAMTPVTCLAVGTMVTGIVQYFLARNGGFHKIRRNIVVYLLLAIGVVAMTQPIWNWVKSIMGTGYPNQHMPGVTPGDWMIFMPPPNATFLDYISCFIFDISAGSNHPIFPYLAMTFVGNIIGLLIIDAKTQSKPSPHLPKHGIYAALLVFATGIALIPVLGLDFASILPVNAIGDITKIHSGLDWFWLPWWSFLLAGEIIVVFMVLRLIEYRGASQEIAPKTKWLRRFGMPAFSVYAWHRFWSAPAIILITTLIGQSVLVPGGTIVGEGQFGWDITLVLLAASWGSCFLILWAWEKVGYIGGIEWMMGEVAALLGPNYRKTKGSQKERAKWYEHGMMDVKALFYNPLWLDIIPRDDESKKKQSDSILAFKLGILGLFIGLFSIISLGITMLARKEEGINTYNKRALVISIVGIGLMLGLIIVTSMITLSALGISF